MLRNWLRKFPCKKLIETSRKDAESRNEHKMNTPNPLHPQGAFLENRGRSQVRIAVFTILAIHVVLLGALLLQGCKRTVEPPLQPDQTSSLPPIVEPVPAPPPTQAVISPLPPTPPPTQTIVTPQPPPGTEVPTLAGTEHVVVKGDTFGKLAKQYKVSTKAIADANPGVDSTKLKIGQKLKIPPASANAPAPTTSTGPAASTERIYTVKSGDVLFKIAQANGVSVKQLRSANNLKTDQIKVGQKLKIPAKASAPTAPAETTPTGTSLPATVVPMTPPATNP